MHIYNNNCLRCSRETVKHESCHIRFELLKPYDEYLKEAYKNNVNIINKYSAPSWAKVPQQTRIRIFGVRVG